MEGVSPLRNLKGLEWQPALSAHIDAKRLFGRLATRPPDRPPDPENGSPGTVDAVTGAEVQTSVLLRTTPNYSKSAAHASPATPAQSAALRIVIEPTASGRKWTASLNDRMLCVTVWPFVKSARLLLAAGYPADAIVEMWRPNTDEWALRGRLAAVAATVIDGETARAAPRTGCPFGKTGWPLSPPG